ncbi:MAG: hypothetical protein JSS83_01420 [Cyanobacteria bacterium SZAS LIN-3]|nr:hypothetical protein [Cyanobacteria bacterium SZAS LIN-3]
MVISQKAKSPLASCLPSAIVFACALAVALLHHFAFAHPRTTFLYDARSYLSSTAHICECILSLVHGHPDLGPISNKDFLAAIVNDGPVLPGTFAAIFALFGHVPVNKDWTFFELIQSVMHAVTATLVCTAAARATKMTAAGIFAGLVWATYPAAVINSGRFYNEPLMVLLLMAALVSASRRPATALSTTAGSYFSGLAFLMKPALVAGAGFSYLCILLATRTKKLLIPFIALGIIFAFGPWAMYTKAYLGKAYFTTPRNSTYNIAMGNDTEVDGCLTSPMPPLTSIFANDPQPMYFMYAQWANNTQAYLTMVLRKATRMYSHPWNDFRHKYFGLSAEAQRVWHLFLLFGGCFGLFMFISDTLKRNKLDFDNNSVQIISLGWLAAPKIYLLFEANSRYGFSITPFLAVFCALPFAAYVRLWQEKQEAKEENNGRIKKTATWLIACAAVAFVLTILTANLDNLTHFGQSRETVFTLTPHEVASKSFTLSTAHKPADPASRAFIMVDGDSRLEEAKVYLNGKLLAGGLKHLRYFYPSKYSEYYVFQELGYSMDELPENYRQWRILEISPTLINWGGDNKIEIRAPDTGMLIYGESDPRTRHYLSPLYYSPIKIGNASRGLETRLVMPDIKADIPQTSSRVDAAGHSETLPGALRIHFVLADTLPENADKGDPAAQTQAQWPALKRHFDITSKNFDPCFSTGKVEEIHTSRHVVDGAASVCSDFSIPRTPGSNAVRLSLSGFIKASKAKSKVGLLLVSKNKAGQPVLISRTPPYLQADTQWQPFRIDDILPEGELADGPVTLTIGIYPGPWVEICGYSCDRTSADAIIKDLKLDIEPAYQLDLSKFRLILL